MGAVRLHAYYTDRVLARPEPSRRLRRSRRSITSAWTVRLPSRPCRDRRSARGSHPGCRRCVSRHDRTAPTPSCNAARGRQKSELLLEVRSGRLTVPVHAVLAEAGHRVPHARRERPAGLSRREVEVLRLLARGLSNRDIAAQLFVAPTRSSITSSTSTTRQPSPRGPRDMFAMEHSLL